MQSIPEASVRNDLAMPHPRLLLSQMRLLLSYLETGLALLAGRCVEFSDRCRAESLIRCQSQKSGSVRSIRLSLARSESGFGALRRLVGFGYLVGNSSPS